MVVKAFHAHTHNMQESQDNAADSGNLIIRLPGLLLFCCLKKRTVIELDKIECTSLEG